jgi:hypothetical protein
VSVPLIPFSYFQKWAGAEYAPANSEKRPRVEQAIAVASRMVADCIRLPIVREDRTDILDWRAASDTVILPAWPVLSVTEVRFSLDQDWADEDTLAETPDEYVWTRGGRISFRAAAPEDARQSVRVIYRAGLVESLADLIAEDGNGAPTSEFSYIAIGTAMQALHILRRHDNLAGTTETTGQASFGFQGPVRLLPIVRDLLRPLTDWQAS